MRPAIKWYHSTGWSRKITAVTRIALSLQFRVMNSTMLTVANSRSTSPAGKKAALSVANTSSRIIRQRKRHPKSLPLRLWLSDWM